MKSPLEEKPEVLQRIGLFIVLFNLIDADLGHEFYFIINQMDEQKRPVLNFLATQDFAKKLDMLQVILGEDLYAKVKKINEFRTFIAHGVYGMDNLGNMSLSKQKRITNKYHSINDLNTELLDGYIKEERDVLASFHDLVVKRLPKK